MLNFVNVNTKEFLKSAIIQAYIVVAVKSYSLLLLGGFGLLHQIDLLFNFDFTLSLQLTTVITPLLGNGNYFPVYHGAFTIAVFHAELRETPFASEVAEGALKSREGRLFILNIILIFGTDFEHVDCSLVRGAAYILIIGIDGDVGDHGLHGTSPQLDQRLLRVRVEQSDQRSLLRGRRQDGPVLLQAQHCH